MDDDPLRSKSCLDLALDPGLLFSQIIVVLDQQFKLAARAVVTVVDFTKTIHPQQICQLDGINPVALVWVLCYPCIVHWVRDHHAVNQPTDYIANPWRHFPRFEVNVNFPFQRRKGGDKIFLAHGYLFAEEQFSALLHSGDLKQSRSHIETSVNYLHKTSPFAENSKASNFSLMETSAAAIRSNLHVEVGAFAAVT